MLLYALSTPLAAGGLLRWAQTPVVTAVPPDAEAIVVLGGDVLAQAPEYGGATVGPLTLQRLRHGARLQRATGLPLMVCGGVVRTGTPPVATLMRRVLDEELDVPVRWTETRSTNTRENAQEAAAILAGDGVRRILVVTHAWHAPRALACLAEAGLEATAAATAYAPPPQLELPALLPSAKALLASRRACHELLGRIWYDLRR